MLILVTGATGFIGSRVVKALIARGDRVRALSRGNRELPPDVEVASCDLLEPIPKEVCDGADAVLHLAGELRDPARMAVNVVGTRHLLEAARDVPVWIQLSSIGVYGARGAGTVTESTKPTPRDGYERSKLEADELVCRERARAQYALLRPSIVYGAGMRSSALHSLAAAVRSHRFVYFGRPGAIAPYVHVDDVVAALLELLDRARGDTVGPRAQGAYDLSHDVALEAFMDALAHAMGAQPPTLRVPLALGRAATLPSRLTKKWPLTRDRLAALTSRVRFPSRRLEQEFGWTPRVSHERGLAELFAGGSHA